METTRYNRQIILPEIGICGQEKLEKAKVLIIGLGGLGSAVLPYLVAAGVGEIGIMDDDSVDISNLQRQVIYKSNSLGKSKVLEAAAMALQLNPSIKINTYTEKLDINNAISLFDQYNIMVDATDNLNTKYLINDVCCLTNKPFVYGSIYRFEGQVSVFNYQNGPTFRCLFPEEAAVTSSCNDAGVLGVSVGIIGMFQANEVLKAILNIGEVMSGKLLIYNTLNNEQRKFEFSKIQTTCIDKSFLENKYSANKNTVIEIDASLALEQINNSEIVFLDVRNFEESPKITFENCIQIPLDNLESELHRLAIKKEIFVFCQSGIRSKTATELLSKHKFNKVKNITGGAVNLDKLLNKTILAL